MKTPYVLAAVPALLVAFACGPTEPAGPADEHDAHVHGGGDEHGAGDAAHAHDGAGEEHAHDEVPLGTAQVGDLTVTFAQGHGAVAAGHEGHLVVKLPYSDRGETIVRGWIGGADRSASLVGRAEYAAAHDDYDLHATAPDPLPEGVRWWVELQRPAGTRVVGSVAPILE